MCWKYSHIYHVIYKDFWDNSLLCSHLRKLMLAEISFLKTTQLGRNWIGIQPNFPALRPLIIHDCASIRLRHNLLYECPHGSGWESVKLYLGDTSWAAWLYNLSPRGGGVSLYLLVGKICLCHSILQPTYIFQRESNFPNDHKSLIIFLKFTWLKCSWFTMLC